MASAHKFREILSPGKQFEFVKKQKRYLVLSGIVVSLSLAMLLANAFVIESRGSLLNWGVDFRGGTELLIEFNRSTESGDIRSALEGAGYVGADVVSYGSEQDGRAYLVRLGAVSVVSRDKAEALEAALASVEGAALKQLDWSEGGDKIYLRFSDSLEESQVKSALKGAGVETTALQSFGRASDNAFEATLIGMDAEVRKVLSGALGADSIKDIPMVESVGAKAGRQLQIGGVKAVVAAILLIVLYVALRFDFRYGPGTVVALAHDSIVTIGAFALTYREFSLTTLAAVLTIAGYSVNDTIVIFDRIRENAQRFRDRKFDRVVNQSINETLPRTILTSATLLFVTLAMNVLGAGVVRDFAFAMNIGVVVGTYSSIFVASPVLLWLNDRIVASQQKAKASGKKKPARSAAAAV